MSNIEKIRQEIERLKSKNTEWRERINSEDGYSYESDVCCGYEEAIEDFETFIDSLPEEKSSEDLEVTASRLGFDYVDNIVHESPEHRWNDHDVEFGYRDGFIAGAKRTKEQMMKGAVEAEIENASFGILYLRKNLGAEGYLTGDKVKVIVIKEDEK